MTLGAIGLFGLGLLLSAFFSGCETGLYRVPRLRLVIDSLSGNWWARVLLSLTNRPSLFVATTLVGNNVANYFAGFSIVLLAQQLLGDAPTVELLAPIVLSPLVFVYGELLPKNLFFQAPYGLLTRLAPVFLVFTVIFFPLSLVLWSLGRVLEMFLGQSPTKARLSLARREVDQVLKESQDVGLLRPAQRSLAQNLFSVASKEASEFSIPTQRLPGIRMGSSRQDALRYASRNRLTALPVIGDRDREPIGYVRTIDLFLQESATVDDVRPLISILESELHSGALIHLQSEKEALAKVVNQEGETTGFVAVNDLVGPLLTGNLASLRR